MTRSTRRPPLVRVLALLGAALLATGLAACSDEPEAEPTAAPTTTTRAPVVSENTETVAPVLRSSVLTGLPVADGPVLAVKIDNTAKARPRVGINSADVVYVEPVEGGATRLNAVFSTRMPAQVGPVRSARVSDGSILQPYGPVAFAYSGGSEGTVVQLRQTPLVHVSMDTSGEGFRREGGRSAPYNVIGDPAALLARAGGSVAPADIGFRFGPLPAGGTPVSSGATRYNLALLQFVWSAGEQRWLLTTDGTADVDSEGKQVGPTTVVFQQVPVVASGNRDVTGAVTPDVVLTGSGQATVLRDGQAFNAQWSRPEGSATTSFTLNGAEMPFAAGQVWVVLVSPTQGVTLG
ncbi:DUF3048 domain-containing protein [Angustibacter speluncae]